MSNHNEIAVSCFMILGIVMSITILLIGLIVPNVFALAKAKETLDVNKVGNALIRVGNYTGAIKYLQ